MLNVQKSKRQLCIMACSFCRNPAFLRWLSVCSVEAGMPEEPFTEEMAKDFILVICHVESRNELDTNEAAAQRFHLLVREPYMQWKERN